MPAAVPATCELSHASFRLLKDPVFRLSEGAVVPSMVIHLESQEAVLPLRSIAREFAIAPDSPDGKMLDLIEQALEYVVAIRIGDKLPSELVGGEASWDPNGQDRRIADSRIRYNLVRCVAARMGKSVDLGLSAPGWEENPGNKALLTEAITDAAQIEGTDSPDITGRIAAISEEMAYIESMRRILARATGHLREKLLRLKMDQVPISRQDTVKQVQSLARTGLTEILSRFDDVDVRLDDNTLAMLRDTAATTAWMRKQRDWLFRTNHSWGSVFTAWANAPADFDDFLWKVVERTYVFLAPRFMSFQEWKVAETRLRKDKMHVTVW
jgi:hypothetical protein